ncbi:hypothetical protein EGT07_01210 [Herbaspirillum sp. HC18]|nr:hypothetical protein EGT07_01210 [Herbaspirillum sp. HC18]
MERETWWLLVGFLGQGLFMMRFVIQWIQSERQRKSVVPLAFWYFSLLGGVTLLVYSIYRKDPVFIAGQLLGIGIYLRNLALIKAERLAGTEQTD